VTVALPLHSPACRRSGAPLQSETPGVAMIELTDVNIAPQDSAAETLMNSVYGPENDEPEFVEEAHPPTVQEIDTNLDTLPFRPLHRPPMALMCILDDDGEHGEWLRLRGHRVTIGRLQADITIPLDSMMSSPHAELALSLDDGCYRWSLTDLNSLNGTHVRIHKSYLRHNQELLIGSRRYRFDAAPQGDPAVEDGEVHSQNGVCGTRCWREIELADAFPSLVELKAHGDGQHFLLTHEDNWIGRNSARCSVVLGDDPFVSPEHARIYRNRQGRWRIKNHRSLNGVWLRVTQLTVEAICHFQLGEQRFLVKVV
jgi:hypothetical protein